MPRRVRQWRLALECGNATTRRYLEQYVRLEVRRLCGVAYAERLFLSLPSKKHAKGTFSLGTVLYGTEQHSFGIFPREVLQNIAVFGRSGSGKTNVVFQLLLALQEQRVPFLFLDWKRTARHLLPLLTAKTTVCTAGRSVAPFAFNPLLVPPGVDRSVYVMQVVDVMASAFTLGEGAKSVLQEAILSCYERKRAPTFRDVRDALAAIATTERKTGWKLSATRAIESVIGATPDVSEREQQAFTEGILRYNTIVELDSLPQSVKKFVIPMLCSWVYSVRLASGVRERLRLVVVFEEAHHVLYRQESRSTETLMNQLIRQGRELGISCVVVDQHPHLMSSAALGNCYTTVCLNQKNPSDINKAAQLSLLTDAQKQHLSRLPVGDGVVKLQDRWHHPFLVRFPLVPVQKGCVTDAMLRDLAQGTLTLSTLRERLHIADDYTGEARERLHGDSCVIQRSRTIDTLDAEASALLRDIATYPDDGVDARYKRLGVSAAKGNAWKKQLTRQGLVASHRTKVGRTYRVVLRPTAHARLLLSDLEGDDPQASFAHEYVKRDVAGRLEHQGYRVTLEAPRTKSSGCMDILAEKRTERIAFEIETGASNFVSNVKRNLLEGFKKVRIVATSKGALQKIERALAKAGLLIPGRVDVVGVGERELTL